MQQPWYATREQVKRALDSAETARNNAQVDRAIAAASRSIEQQCHRHFYPWDGTRYKGFRPWYDGSSSWRMWLGEDELVSLTTFAAGGDTISASDYFLEPANSGPPYTSIEIDLSSSATLSAGDTWQRSIALTGTFGYWDEQEQVGTLADNLDASLSDTCTVTWTDPADIGVGSILKVGDERMIISEVSFVDTTQNLGGSGLAAYAAGVTVTVPDSTGFYVGEIIRIEAERMLVVDIGTSTTIIVKRAWDGSVLAAHAAAVDVYGKTGITLSRAQLGSVLAAHTTSDVVYRFVVPPGIDDLCVAESVVQLQAELGGYARAQGELSGQPAPGGLRALREQVRGQYGRKARHVAI